MSHPEIDMQNLRTAACSVVRHLDQLRHAGLTTAAQVALVDHALALALGIDRGRVTDDRALVHANDLRVLLAAVGGPLAAELIRDLDEALEKALRKGA